MLQKARSTVKSRSISTGKSTQLVKFDDYLFFSNWISSTIAEELINTIQSLSEWNVVGGRKVILLGGVPHPNGAISEPFPDWLHSIAERLRPYFNGELPNQVLLNSYENGEGIQFHDDGPLYQSTAAIISLSSDAILRFRPKSIEADSSLSHSLNISSEEKCVALIQNSLFLFSGPYYDDYLHGIHSLKSSHTLDSSHLPSLSSSSPIPSAPTSSSSSSSVSTLSSSIKGEDLNLVEFIDVPCLNIDSLSSTSSPSPSSTHQPLSLSSFPSTSTTTITTSSIVRSTIRYSLTFRRMKHIAKELEEFGPITQEEKNEIQRRKDWWLRSINDDYILSES